MKPFIADTIGVLMCAALICLAILLIDLSRVAVTAEKALDEIPAHVSLIEANAEAGISGVLSRVDATLQRADEALAIVRATATNADARTSQALGIVSIAESDAHNLLDLKLTDLNSQLTTANKTLISAADGLNLLTAKYAALPDNIANDRIFKSYVANGLGLMAAAKLTAGQTEKTMASIDAATPHILSNVDAFTASNIEASKQATLVMGNLAKATKPLPTWVRIGLAVAPPIAQTAAGAATAWTLVH